MIGIDGLEPLFVECLVRSGRSKGFSFFLENGAYALLKSTFLPDTFLAWPTIYTGLLPYHFGLKPEPENPVVLKVDSLRVRNMLIGKTFWDIASKKGKKVCIVNSIFAYPPWKVNGVMVSGPSFGLKGQTLSEPPRDDISVYRVGMYSLTPLLSYEYHKTYSEAIEQLKDVFLLAYKLFNEDSYDLMFVADYTLDRIEHYYWRFNDPKDPLCPKFINSFRNAIDDYYKILDHILSLFIEKFSDEYTIVVLGDHGHTRRPLKLISIDKIINPKLRNHYSSSEVIRLVGMLFTHYTKIDNILYWFLKRFQEKGFIGRILLKENRNSHPLLIESIKEFGLKEYIGLKIRSDCPDLVVSKLREILAKTEIVEEVFTPYEYYEVSSFREFPADIFVKLKGLGNMQSAKSFLVLPNFTRRIVSGGHGMYSMLLIRDPNRRIHLRKTPVRVQDIAPSVLNILGIRTEHHFDGVNVVNYE